MSKFRSFSIVIHNVRDDSKSSVENHFQASGPSSLLVAMEPYPENEGYHIHVFVSYKSQRSFKSMLSSTESLSQKIVTEKPEGETRSWGRVQVDQMRGTFAQATAYLTKPQKDKPVDPNVVKINQAYDDAYYNFELSCKKMNTVYLFADYGYLMVREFIQKEQAKGRQLDPMYSEILYYYELGRPVLEA